MSKHDDLLPEMIVQRVLMLRLTEEEKNEVVTICDHPANLKFSPVLPYACTEHGVLMLCNTLKSDRAIKVSLIVVRTFVQLREMLAGKLAELERKVSAHDQAIAGLINAIRQLMKMPEESLRSIGFTADWGNKEKL